MISIEDCQKFGGFSLTYRKKILICGNVSRSSFWSRCERAIIKFKLKDLHLCIQKKKKTRPMNENMIPHTYPDNQGTRSRLVLPHKNFKQLNDWLNKFCLTFRWIYFIDLIWAYFFAWSFCKRIRHKFWKLLKRLLLYNIIFIQLSKQNGKVTRLIFTCHPIILYIKV